VGKVKKERAESKIEIDVRNCRWCKYRCEVDATIRVSGQNVSLNGCAIKGVYSVNGNVVYGKRCEMFRMDAEALRKAIQEKKRNAELMAGVVKEIRSCARQMEMMLEKYEEGYNDARRTDTKSASAGAFEEEK